MLSAGREWGYENPGPDQGRGSQLCVLEENEAIPLLGRQPKVRTADVYKFALQIVAEALNVR